MTWQLNTAATSASGVATETLEDAEYEALVNVTKLDNGTSVVSLSVLLGPGPDPRTEAERLLDANAWRALPKRSVR